MKTKIIQLFAISVVLVMTGVTAYAVEDGVAPGSVGGATTLTLGSESPDNIISTNVSKNVALGYNGAAGGGTYAAATWHISGNREFATSSTTPTTWWDGCDADPCGTTNALRGSANPTLDVTAGSWTSM